MMRPRLKRGVATAAAAVWLAVLLLWARSRGSTDVLVYSRPGESYRHLQSWNGNLRLLCASDYPFPHAGLRWASRDAGIGGPPPTIVVGRQGRGWILFAGFDEWPSVPALQVDVPYWKLAAISGGAAALPWLGGWVRRLRELLRAGVRRLLETRGRRRWARGLCPRCGYDLRASAVRCPECGTRIPDHPPKSLFGEAKPT